METTPNFERETASQLAAFLAADERPAGTMRYEELAGFLFAIACAPEAIEPSEWLPVIWGDDQSALPFQDVATAQRVTGQIMALYEHIVAGANDESPCLPPGCEMRGEAMANFDPEAPLARWSLGFLDGLHYLEELWEAYSGADADLAEELDYVAVPLIFFASREGAEAMHADSGSEEPFDSVTRSMAEVFPDAMLEYASIAHALVEAAHTPAVSGKVARNGPCPCGSGRKYKKCCGRS